MASNSASDKWRCNHPKQTKRELEGSTSQTERGKSKQTDLQLAAIHVNGESVVGGEEEMGRIDFGGLVVERLPLLGRQGGGHVGQGAAEVRVGSEGRRMVGRRERVAADGGHGDQGWPEALLGVRARGMPTQVAAVRVAAPQVRRQGPSIRLRQ